MNARRSTSGVSSQRIHFTLDDLLRLRVNATVAPHVETYFALRSLVSPGSPGLAEWRLKVYPKLGRKLVLLKKLPELFPSPGLLLRLLQGNAQEARIALVRIGETAERLADAVHEFWQIAVAPYWARIRSHVQTEQAALERMLAVGGVEHLLSNVLGGGHWSTPVLELPHERDGDVRLDGRGLLLVPSLFLPQRQGHLLDVADPHGQSPLLLPTGPVSDPEAFWAEPEDEDMPSRRWSAPPGRVRWRPWSSAGPRGARPSARHLGARCQSAHRRTPRRRADRHPPRPQHGAARTHPAGAGAAAEPRGDRCGRAGR